MRTQQMEQHEYALLVHFAHALIYKDSRGYYQQLCVINDDVHNKGSDETALEMLARMEAHNGVPYYASFERNHKIHIARLLLRAQEDILRQLATYGL